MTTSETVVEIIVSEHGENEITTNMKTICQFTRRLFSWLHFCEFRAASILLATSFTPHFGVSRPHPNECSGGDLDVDLYFVSWDKKLIPPRTVPPMDYTASRPRVMDHDVILKEIQRFFVDNMISDSLGAISNSHLILADRKPEKAPGPKCLRQASLHSMAVDFAKTGAPAEMPSVLKPREYPDFVERWDKPTYKSEGPLGKLYRTTLCND